MSSLSIAFRDIRLNITQSKRWGSRRTRTKAMPKQINTHPPWRLLPSVFKIRPIKTSHPGLLHLNLPCSNSKYPGCCLQHHSSTLTFKNILVDWLAEIWGMPFYCFTWFYHLLEKRQGEWSWGIWPDMWDHKRWGFDKLAVCLRVSLLACPEPSLLRRGQMYPWLVVTPRFSDWWTCHCGKLSSLNCEIIKP